MTRIHNATLEAFLVFGKASIAVSEVTELAFRVRADASADDLLFELRNAHAQLRELFADGFDDAVYGLASDVMDLASRTAVLLNQGR